VRPGLLASVVATLRGSGEGFAVALVLGAAPGPSAGDLAELLRAVEVLLGLLPRRGRPPGITDWSEGRFRARLAEAYAAAAAHARRGRRPAQVDVAIELGIPLPTFRSYLRRWRIGWPPP
jgi:hypothetical protein